MGEEEAALIESVVDDRDILEDAIQDARRAKIQGDDAQPQISDLLDSHDPLFQICAYEYKQRRVEDTASIVAVTENLAAEGLLAESTADEFIDLWSDIEWIVPGVGIQVNNLGGLEKHWSDIAIEIKSDRPEMLGYQMLWGVDDQIEAEVPGSRIIDRALMELRIIADFLENWDDHEEVGDEMMSYLSEEYDLPWTTDMLRDVLDQFEALEQSNGGMATATDNLNIDVRWDDETGDDIVVGTIRVTPPGEKVVDPKDDTSDTPPRGFQ